MIISPKAIQSEVFKWRRQGLKCTEVERNETQIINLRTAAHIGLITDGTQRKSIGAHNRNYFDLT